MRRSTLFVGPLLLLSSSQEAATVATELQRLATGLWGFRRSRSDSHGMPWLNHGDSWGTHWTHWTHHGKGHPWTIPAGSEGNFRGTIFFAKSCTLHCFLWFSQKVAMTPSKVWRISFLLFWKSTPGNSGIYKIWTHNHKTSHNHLFWYFLICFVHDVGTYHKQGLRVWNFGLIGWAEFLCKYLRAKLLGTRAERILCWRLAAKRQWIFSRSWPFIVDFPTKNGTLC